MRTKTALKDVLLAAIGDAAADSMMERAYLHGTARGPVDVEKKVLRIDITGLTRTMSPDPKTQEMNVGFVIQCFFLPTDDTLEAQDEAQDASLDLAFEVYEYLSANRTLDGQVCDLIFPEDEENCVVGIANLSGQRYGATYLGGIVNPI